MKTETVNVIKVMERKLLQIVVENRQTLTFLNKKPTTYHYMGDGIYVLTYSNNIDLIWSLERKLRQFKLLLSSTTCMLGAYYDNYLCGELNHNQQDVRGNNCSLKLSLISFYIIGISGCLDWEKWYGLKNKCSLSTYNLQLNYYWITKWRNQIWLFQ